MTTIHIKRGDEPEQVIDCAPIEQYEEELREALRKREFFKNSHRIEALRAMSRDQLMHLASILTFMVEEYAHLYDNSFSPEHEKTVRGMREIARAADEAGVDLWKDWPELRGGDEEVVKK